MSAKILEARAIITGEDRTAKMFAAIEARVARLKKQVEGFSRAANRFDFGGAARRAGAGEIERLAKSQAQLATAVERMERSVRRLSGSALARGSVGLGGHSSYRHGGIGDAVATGALGTHGRHYLPLGVAGLVALAVHEMVVKPSVERAHEVARERLSGMTPAEVSRATYDAAHIAASVPAVGQTEAMHMLRNARAVMGSYDEAAKIMEPLARLRVFAQAQRPGEDVSEDFDKLVKGLEIKGATRDPKVFQEYMDGIAKGLSVFGDTLRASQFYDMFKYGRQATPGLSSDFILSTAPTLAQELGGSSYGKAVSSFNNAVVSGTMTAKAVKEMVRLGLLSYGDVDKKGALKAGRAVHGWEIAQSNPNEWVKQYLLPAMAEHGITDSEHMMKEIGELFSNKMAAQMVSLLATQQSKIDKDARLVHGAMGLQGADYALRNDPDMAFHALIESLKSLGATIGSDLAKDFAGPMADLAKSIAGFNEYIAKLHADPNYESPQIKGMRRLGNKLIAGIDSDKGWADLDQFDFLDGEYQQARDRFQRMRNERGPDAPKGHGVTGLRKAAHGGAPKGFEGTWKQLDQHDEYPLRAGADKEIEELDRLHAARVAAQRALLEQRQNLIRVGRWMNFGRSDAALSPFVGSGTTDTPMGVGSYFQTSRASAFGGIDPSTGAPKAFGPHLPPSAAPPAPAMPDLASLLSGKIEAKVAPDQITAKVEGQVTGMVSISINPSPDLIAKITAAKGGSDKNFNLNLGSGAPGTTPAGRTPSGR